MSDNHVEEDAFMLSFQVHDYQGKMWVDGSDVDFKGSKGGNFTVYDYSRNWRADLQSHFDCVNFYVSRKALTSLEEEIGTKKLESFNIAPGVDTNDPVVRGIASSMLPLFDGQLDTNQLLLDYIGTGMLVHLTSTYSGIRSPAIRLKGGLTPRQLNRATEMLAGNLHGALALSDIARACGLSASYFARAFKISTGVPPHKWLAGQRIEKAVDLLKTTSLALSDIADQCGFTDQAHFSRSFAEAKGVPPSVWRRERQSGLFSLFGNSKSPQL